MGFDNNKGRWPIGLGVNVKAYSEEEVSGSNLRASPFLVLIRCNIYIYIYNTNLFHQFWRWHYPGLQWLECDQVCRVPLDLADPPNF
jgi:hypothetical protein